MDEALRLPNGAEVARFEDFLRSLVPWDMGDTRLAVWGSAAACAFILCGVMPILIGDAAAGLYRLVARGADGTERSPDELRAKLPVEDWFWQPSVDRESPVITEAGSHENEAECRPATGE